MELITNATCPGLSPAKPCGVPTRDFDPTKEPVPLCSKCKADDWLFFNPPPRKARKSRSRR